MKIEIEYDEDDGRWYLTSGRIHKVFITSLQLYNYIDELVGVLPITQPKVE